MKAVIEVLSGIGLPVIKDNPETYIKTVPMISPALKNPKNPVIISLAVVDLPISELTVKPPRTVKIIIITTKKISFARAEELAVVLAGDIK